MSHLMSRLRRPITFLCGLGAVIVACWPLCLRGEHPAMPRVVLGDARIVPEPQDGLPIYPYSPDMTVSMLEQTGTDQLLMFWAGSISYRTIGPSLDQMRDPRPVIGPGKAGDPDNGGAWLMSVHRTDPTNPRRLIGFYHAEDHQFAADPESRFVAWKSLAACISEDDGASWTKRGTIIASARPKPEEPAWGGNGDGCVVWDPAHRRWLCFYQEHWLMMAMSADPDGRPGSWKKWHGGAFAEPGLGGQNTPIPALSVAPGGNPSVHWNTFLELWVMVWHTWDSAMPARGSIMISTSADLLEWRTPQVLLKPAAGEKLWYPTILSPHAGRGAQRGREALLLYARFPNREASERQFLWRAIRFDR